MTVQQFLKYCKRNKPTKILPHEYGIDFHFKTMVVINATSGIDGMIYTKWRKCRNGSKALFADLQEIAPKVMDDMKRKYSPENNKIFNKMMNP